MTEFSITYTILIITITFAAIMGSVAYLTFAERKVSAYVQDRVGPNRVGPWGLLQPLADGLKFFFKEDIIPRHVDRVFYFLAPGVGVATALLAFCVVPFGPTPPRPGPVSVDERRSVEMAAATHAEEMRTYRESSTFAIAPGLDVGILLSFAVGSLVVYGIILGGWSSNSKYSLLGSLRSSAQIISYEIPLSMSALSVVLLAGSLNLEKIQAVQALHGWFILYQPMAFLLFMVSVYAECNRLPFDLPEAEQELVGGFHTEYGSMKLGLMLMVDYIHMITTSFFMAILFFGGWQFPWLSAIDGTFGLILKFLILGGKVAIFLMIYLFIRWTIPRFKFDQLMALAWKVMIPLSIANVILIMAIREFALNLWLSTLASVILFFVAAIIGTRKQSRVSMKVAY